MPVFTAIATTALAAIGVTSSFFVGAYSDPSIVFDPAEKRRLRAALRKMQL